MVCQGIPNTLTITQCINMIDCFNNGMEPGNGTKQCGESADCHEEDVGFCKVGKTITEFCFANFPCVDPDAECVPGSAGSEEACNAAIKKRLYCNRGWTGQLR